jgi:hypothetical protein
MIQQEYKNNVQSTSSAVEATGFSISVNESMFQLLTANIYTDTVLAVVREWSTNSIDVCIAAKLPVKFDVHLPTLSEPYFNVRDYGTGLPPEDITGLFSNLGASTKRDSNELNGSLGLGRMAGLAVSDAFTVDSYYQGKQYSYAISMQQGIPVTLYMGESDTAEPNGLKLAVSVEYNDIAQYKEKAENLFKYFDYKPSVNIDLEMELDVSDHISDNWFIKRTGYDSSNYVVMSQVAYKVPGNSQIEDFGFRGLVIKAPPGSVTFNPGRESLSLNKTTIAYLNKAFKEVKEEYVYAATIAMAACGTDKELMQCYRKVAGDAPWGIVSSMDPTPFTSVGYQQLFSSTYRSARVDFKHVGTGEVFNLATADNLSITYKNAHYKNSKEMNYSNTQGYYTFFNANHVIIDLKTKYRSALNNKYEDKDLICWQRKGKSDIDEAVSSAKDYLDGLGISYLLASDIVKEAGISPDSTTAPREGFFASNVCVKSRNIDRSSALDIDTAKDGTYLYLKLSNTTPVLASSSLVFEDYVNAYKMLNKVIHMPVIKGVAKKYQSFADSLDNWVDFETYIEEKMKESTFKVPLDVVVPRFNFRVIDNNSAKNYPEDIQEYYKEVNSYHNFNTGTDYVGEPIDTRLVKLFGSSTVSYVPSVEIDMDHLSTTYPTALPMLNSGSGHYGMPDNIVSRIAALEKHYAVHSIK